MPVPTSATDARLPVTLLSGFLGAGKTTLLSYILKSKDHGLRCAVVVNDMGVLNIDAALITNHKLTQKEEKVVQMQNGCICCTLRADLLEEIATLAEAGLYDYLIIESSGISEPIQVAETFTPEFAETMTGSSVQEIEASLPEDKDQTVEGRKRLAELIAAGGLSKVARLDCCVSLVDCTTFMGDFDTTDFLSDRYGKEVGEEDERNITDLLTDQIEFANVILLNKTDMMPKKQVDKVEQLVKTLNPSAKIIRTKYSKVDLHEILNTNLFDFSTAASGAGWLHSLRESTLMEIQGKDGEKRMVPKPETLEYGISSFVYSSRRPFHPKRLWEVVSAPFCVIQTEFEEEEDSDDEAGPDEDDTEDSTGQNAEAMEMAEDQAKLDALAKMEEQKAELDLPARAAFKRGSEVWKGVLRSKGFIWLATRLNIHGEWSQAGIMFTIGGGGEWMCRVPEEEWPGAGDKEVIDAIKLDFQGEWGDRRQELVFIGQDLDQELIKKTMDDACLNDKEWAVWQKTMRSRKSEEKKIEKLYNIFDDGWEAWPEPSDHDHDHAEEEGGGDDEAHPHGLSHSHAGHKHSHSQGRAHAHVVGKNGAKVKVSEVDEDSPSPPKRAKTAA